MISIDLQAVQSDYINWQALVNKALAGERVVILRSGVEVANILPSVDNISEITPNDVKTKPIWHENTTLSATELIDSLGVTTNKTATIEQMNESISKMFQNWKG